jgi:hypothetical protein
MITYVQDIDLDDNFDLTIVNGDFLITESDQNHVISIINSYTGAWKEYPLVGVGLIQYLAGSVNSDVVKRAIQTQLITDGYNVQDIKVLKDFTYEINAIRI